MAIFFSAATAAGAFGGLLARGIVEMDGVGGKPGWAWIFILEGIITLAVGKHPDSFFPGCSKTDKVALSQPLLHSLS